MFEETNLFWFGILLEVGFVLIILRTVAPTGQAIGESLSGKLHQLRQDYRRVQQTLQEQKTQLTQECARLRQELQVQHETLMREHLQHQNEWQIREQQLTQDNLRQQQEWQTREQQLTAEINRLQQVIHQRETAWLEERENLQQELEVQRISFVQQQARLRQELEAEQVEVIQERDYLQQAWLDKEAALAEECDRLRQTLEKQSSSPLPTISAGHLDDQPTADDQTETLHQETFRQLQTLLVNYPSASKIAQAKPDLPAKNLTSMFAPLDNLLQSWGYEVIGPVWEQVPYDPQLHQPDATDIQPGELIYIRFVGYRHGETILCPAKVSRTLPGTKG